MDRTESILIDPPRAVWTGLIGARDGHGPWSSPESRRAFRCELGLSAGAPIVMTGHQASIWHAGILAKYLAAAAVPGATPAWLVVDQDDNDPGLIHYPAVPNGTGPIVRRTLSVRGESRDPVAASVSTPSCRRRPLRFEPPEDALPACRDGLSLMLGALHRHVGAPNAAEQFGLALADLLGDLRLGLSLNAPTIYATRLSSTALFAELLDRMRADPMACISAYNAAAGAVPNARVAPLVADDLQYRFELPLWHIASTGPGANVRKRVYAEDLDHLSRHELVPRALLLTGLMRLAGCDLFIHGTGGGLYDTITERWFERWLPGESLAPGAVVSATRFIPAATGRIPTDPARADWLAHHARHTPALVGDELGAAQKAMLLKLIAAAPRQSSLRRDAYAKLLQLLKSVRTDHAESLRRFDDAAATSRRRAAEDEVVFDRTYPFPLLGRESLRALADAVRHD